MLFNGEGRFFVNLEGVCRDSISAGLGHSGSASSSWIGVEGGLSLRIFGIVGRSIEGTEDRDRLGDGREASPFSFLGLGLLPLGSYTGDDDLGSEESSSGFTSLSKALLGSVNGLLTPISFAGSSSESGLLGESPPCFDVLFAFVLFRPDMELVPLNPSASFRLRGVRAGSGV